MATFVLTVVLSFTGVALLIVALAASANNVGARGFVIAAAVCLGLAVWGVADMARAHEPYSSWKIPGSTISCCSDKDCRPIRSYVGDDGLHYVFLSGRWQPVPNARVMSIPSPDGNSHLCARLSDDFIYCFVAGMPKG